MKKQRKIRLEVRETEAGLLLDYLKKSKNIVLSGIIYQLHSKGLKKGFWVN